MNENPGKFISFEGGEGSGKSTQLKLLARAFEASGQAFVSTREPGGTPGGEQIRNLLVTGAADAWDPVSETLLFYAARCEHVNRLIKPALDEGKHVLCDRFADSTIVYQGIGKNLSEAYVQNLHRLTLGNFMPDLTFILDIEPSAGLARAKSRAGNETRFEEMELDFHARIRSGFLSIAARKPMRCVVVDAKQTPEAMHRAIIAALAERLDLQLKPAA